MFPFAHPRVRTHLAQGMRYGIAGLAGTAADFLGFNAVLFLTPVDARLASVISAPLGLSTVFLLNKYYAFRGRPGRTRRQLVRFGLVYGVAMLFNVSLTALFITAGLRLLSHVSFSVVANVSKALAVGCVMLWNYTLLHAFVFADRAERQAQA